VLQADFDEKGTVLVNDRASTEKAFKPEYCLLP